MSESETNRTLEKLAIIERGDAEQMRISLDEFTSEDGKAHRYISIRKWYRKDDGQWCPTKAGVTVRQREIMEVGKALRAGLDAMNDLDGGNRFARSRLQPTAPRQPEPPDDVHNWDELLMADSETMPWFTRAVELCRQGYDIDAARMIARCEWQDRQRRLDANEPERRPVRMVGFERGTNG